MELDNFHASVVVFYGMQGESFMMVKRQKWNKFLVSDEFMAVEF